MLKGLSVEEILGQIEIERASPCAPTTLLPLVEELTRRSVYPSESTLTALYPKRPADVLKMIDYWGARWHLWAGQQACPHCATDLRDLQCGPPFKREIALTHHDRVTAWLCPDCSHRW